MTFDKQSIDCRTAVES